MRHSQPNTLTLLVSGYPDVQGAMSAILLEADEIIVKPFEAGKLAELLRDKMVTRKPAARVKKERVAAVNGGTDSMSKSKRRPKPGQSCAGSAGPRE
jgi:DNA-binding NtrC family response regulator